MTSCLIRQDQADIVHLGQTSDKMRLTRPFKSNPIMRANFHIIWPLVVYFLIYITVDIIPTNHNHNSLSNRDEYHRDHHNEARTATIKHNVPSYEVSRQAVNADRSLPLTRRQQQLKSCSSHNIISDKQKQGLLSTSSSSSSSKPQPTTTTTTAEKSTYLSSFTNHLSRTLFGPKVLIAQAAPNSALYQADQDKEIIVLNSTNFNTELIQYEHPFPHIKLIEYYLPYCGICMKFKNTYTQLAKDIYTWRNVIRPSAIDLGVSSNSPIAHSWSVDVVPTLRIHPPPNPSQASRLHKQLSSWSPTRTSSELQKLMYEEYNGANLFISSLGVVKYTTNDNSKREPLFEKVALLKSDLLRYIERYVHQNELPSTWPNLRPVTEASLMELRRRHPRQELFLIIETGPSRTPTASDSNQSSSQGPPSPGLSMVMEMSSSAAWKAIRYVRASENRALIEDVIAQKKKELEANEVSGDGSSEHVRLLNDLLEARSNDDASNTNNQQMVLIHIDYSHSPWGQMQQQSRFPMITIVTGSDLMTIERSTQLHQQSDYSRSKRTASITENNNLKQRTRSRRSSGQTESDFNQISLQRKIELVTLFVNQKYTETKEDREFVEALASLDEDPTSFATTKREAVEKFQTTRANQATSSSISPDEAPELKGLNGGNQSESKLLHLVTNLNPFDSRTGLFVSPAGGYQNDDYEDKLKALRYMFFNEIPRKSLLDKSLVEKQEKLNTLVNLVAVIRAYFPLPDSASIQFLEGVQSYLIKQQQYMLSLSNSQQQQTTGSAPIFDTLAFKRELKRLEAEGKRLPDIRDWKHCKLGGGYSCALWRLFHTLTAFEYKKLSQIYQQQQQQQQVVMPQQQKLLSTGLHGSQSENQSPSSSSLMPATETSQGNDVNSLAPAQPTTASNLNGSTQLASPVERVVSPPSTTTSLSLTIATPISPSSSSSSSNRLGILLADGSHSGSNELADLPMPVLLVMRDYITQFFSCEECAKNFRQETSDLSLDKIRQQPAEFSIFWLWETHNRVSKRLSVDPDTNVNAHPRNWFPSYEQCQKCYRKPPSYLGDKTIEPAAIFSESIEWNREETLNYLVREYTQQPMELCGGTNIFGYQVPYGLGLITVIGVCSLALIALLRCASCYIQRQLRHKANLLMNGNGAHYSMELQ